MDGNKSTNHRNIGTIGEQKAVEFLRNLGYNILCSNYHYSNRGEIDIIAKDSSFLVFIEVKTALTTSYGEPEYWVTPSKQKQIIKVAQAYLYSKKINDVPCRFDVIVLKKQGADYQIEHFINAFS